MQPVRMSAMPSPSRAVIRSPNTVMPKMMAVTGSSAPRMAVGVEPMYWMALVVQRNEMAVGKIDSASTLSHMYQRDGTVSSTPVSSLTMKSDKPNSRT